MYLSAGCVCVFVCAVAVRIAMAMARKIIKFRKLQNVIGIAVENAIFAVADCVRLPRHDGTEFGAPAAPATHSVGVYGFAKTISMCVPRRSGHSFYSERNQKTNLLNGFGAFVGSSVLWTREKERERDRGVRPCEILSYSVVRRSIQIKWNTHTHKPIDGTCTIAFVCVAPSRVPLNLKIQSVIFFLARASLATDAHPTEYVGAIKFEIREPHFAKSEARTMRHQPPQIYGMYKTLNRCKNVFALHSALAASGAGPTYDMDRTKKKIKSKRKIDFCIEKLRERSCIDCVDGGCGHLCL